MIEVFLFPRIILTFKITCLFVGPTKADNRVKVRVRRINKGGKNSVAGELQNKQTLDLEKSVQKELEKAGLGNGGKFCHIMYKSSMVDSIIPSLK